MNRILCLLLACIPWCPAAAAQGKRPPMVTEQTEKAIRRGLDWLAAQGWNTHHFSQYPTAMTALAGLAWLASGSTPTRGRYARKIREAINRLTGPQSQQANGLLTIGAREGRSMYGHGFSLFFLAEAYGMTGDRRLRTRLRQVLVKAIALSQQSQTSLGGYGYEPNTTYDEGSVTVTQIQGLRACMNAGIHVPRSVIEKSISYLHLAQSPDGGIRYRAGQGGAARPALGAAGLATVFSYGALEHEAMTSEFKRKFLLLRTGLINYCKNYPWVYRGGSWHLYTHVYLSQGLHQLGGRIWTEYYPKIREGLVNRQNGDGSWRGSYAGFVYGTSLACLILQIPYKKLPMFQR